MKYLNTSINLPPLSDEQRNAANANWNGKSVSINACAGSGKSHTMRAIARSYNGQVESVTFGRGLADEEQKVFSGSPNVNSLNFHRRGLRLCGKVQIDGNKLGRLAGVLNLGNHAAGAAELAAMFKNEAVGTWQEALTPECIAAKYGYKPELIPLALRLLEASDNEKGVLDFGDMLRFPVLLGRKDFVPGESLILLDEVQDYTPASFVFLSSCVAPEGSRVSMVGDPSRQCLMAFAGADPALFDKMADFYECERHFLTVNRRCSKSVVDNAPFKGDMKALPDAPQGEVSSRSQSEIIEAAMQGEYAKDAIISEANAPLVLMGVQMLINSVPVQMRTTRLEGMIRRYVPYKFLDTRYTKLGDVAEKARAENNEYDCDNANQEREDVLKAVDALETYCIAKNITKPRWGRSKSGKPCPIHPIFQALEVLCSGKSGVTLLTGHTAKGLEWENVFHLPGSVKAPTQEWQANQANCLAHVIATRAKLNHYSLV